MNKDIAGKEHWDNLYAFTEQKVEMNYHRTYCEQLLEEMLVNAIEKYQPKSILEAGCGNSIWLPYISEKYGIDVYGIDYSERGCDLVKRRLKKEEDKNRIFCMDFFDGEKRKEIPKVDMLFSLGVIEHFSNAEEVILIFKEMVKENGIILTEVPNIHGLNWLVSKIYQPQVHSKHIIHSIDTLKETYVNNNLKIIKTGTLGHFSLSLFAWGVEPRIERVDFVIRKFAHLIMSKEKHKSGNTKMGPFIYIVGKK